MWNASRITASGFHFFLCHFSSKTDLFQQGESTSVTCVETYSLSSSPQWPLKKGQTSQSLYHEAVTLEMNGNDRTANPSISLSFFPHYLSFEKIEKITEENIPFTQELTWCFELEEKKHHFVLCWPWDSFSASRFLLIWNFQSLPRLWLPSHLS